MTSDNHDNHLSTPLLGTNVGASWDEYGTHGSYDKVLEIQEGKSGKSDDGDGVIRNQLGTFFGVYVPCNLSVFSVILFLRLGWVTGQAGFWAILLIIMLGSLVTFCTILSICAICTNGKMKGGGAYYIISRALGPEFGGAIGIMFYLANAFAAVLYIIGFAEALITYFDLEDTYFNLVIIATVANIIITIICIIGADMFAKFSFGIWNVVIFCIIFCLVSVISQPAGLVNKTIEGFTSWSWETFSHNFGPGYTDQNGESYDFFKIFAIFFPACTGIMAGANMSGDLKDPGRSIPVGTLVSFAVTTGTYVLVVIMLCFTCVREVLLDRFYILQDVSFIPVIVYFGTFAVLWASALASVIGAARVLQALARDNILPVLRYFSKGSIKGDEPRRAVMVTFIIVQGGCLIGNLNTVAPIDTMFFLCSYATLNIACFVLTISGAPNFRPTFGKFTWWTAIIGFLSSSVVMFISAPMYASISLAFLVIIFLYVHFKAPIHIWGDITQALIYHQVRKYLLKLDTRKAHVKYWRPQILLLVSSPLNAEKLIWFVNYLKKGGLFVIGQCVKGSLNENGETCKQASRELTELIDGVGIKAFGEVVITPNFRLGGQNLVLCSGLGGMKPNMIILGAWTSSSPTSERKGHGICKDASEYMEFVRDVVFLEKHLVIARNFEDHHAYKSLEWRKNSRKSSSLWKIVNRVSSLNKVGRYTIDVWPTIFGYVHGYDCPTTGFLILLAHILSHSKEPWRNSLIRICCPIEDENLIVSRHLELKKLVDHLRVKAEIVIVPFHSNNSDNNNDGVAKSKSLVESSRLIRAEKLNRIISSVSRNSHVLFLPMLGPPNDPSLDLEYLEELRILTEDLPPTLSAYSQTSVITDEI